MSPFQFDQVVARLARKANPSAKFVTDWFVRSLRSDPSNPESPVTNTLVKWDEAKLGPTPTQAEIEEEAVNPSPPTPEQTIHAGEEHIISAGFNADRKVTLLEAFLAAKEADALASKPKLVAVYTWMQTVKGMALQGATDFPAAPSTFEEVVSE